MRHWSAVVVLAVLTSGCTGDGTPTPASADKLALLAARADTISLEAQLARLEGLAGAALKATGVGRRAGIAEMEVLSDGLLESRLPFQRLANGYSLESRLRQLQALADRIDAESQRGEDVDSVGADLGVMQQQVQELRQALTHPGRAAPPSIDSLLSAWDATHPTVRANMGTGEPETDENHGVGSTGGGGSSGAAKPDTAAAHGKGAAADTVKRSGAGTAADTTRPGSAADTTGPEHRGVRELPRGQGV